ncbi:MAG: TIGR03086 family metal-binding protein [Actinomycetota bacterium]|nr:TIGR03086 family metal-binding protein [Actinomycetota bacterium]
MSDPNASVVVLSRALDQTGDLLAAVHEDQLSLPTPCAEWNLGRLVAHVVNDPRMFLEAAHGNEVDWSARPEPVTTGWAAEFRSSADDLIHFWHELGDSARPGQADWQTAEFAVHSWDLARAIGSTKPLDPEVAERGLALMSGALTPDNRGKAFGPEVPVPEDAPIYDRLAAYAGRDPR